MYMNTVPSPVEISYTTFPPLLVKMYVLMSNKLNENYLKNNEKWMNTQVEYELEIYYWEWIQTWDTSTED